MKNSDATPLVNATPGIPPGTFADVSDCSACASAGNLTKRNATASAHAHAASTTSKVDSCRCRTASMMSGEHATAPIPHAKFSKLISPALFLPPTSAAVRFVDGDVNP